MAGALVVAQVGQPAMRRRYNPKDKWGRKWLVSVENKTGHACGAIETCFTDPLGTPQQYLALNLENPTLVDINYQQWVNDLKEAWQQYEQRVAECCIALHVRMPKKVSLESLPGEVVRIVGKPPRRWEDIERAAAGDHALLGLTPDPAPAGR